MQVRWDDDAVLRYQVRVSEAAGYNVGQWVHARYVAWIVFLSTVFPLFVLVRLLTPVPLLSSIALSCAVAAGIATLCANYLAADTTITGWLQVARAEWATIRRRAEHRDPRAAAIRGRYRHHQETP